MKRFPRARMRAIVTLVLFVAGAAAHAAEVYRCETSDRHVAFQDRPCTAGRQTRVGLAPAPPPSPPPDYGITPTKPHRGVRQRATPHTREEPRSWECRAADGEVFYRHGSCPRSITATGGRTRGKAGNVAVSAVALPRAEACRRLAAAGSAGRAGRERDERVTTYERNAGRDPCRDW
jgi:uncharacterized protein DUF4124